MSKDKVKNVTLKVLCEVQHSISNHKENILYLQDYFEEVGFEKFSKDFLIALLYVQLNAYYKTFNTYYHHISAFCTKFMAAFENFENTGESLAAYLLNGLIEYHDSSNDCLRFRICETISLIFNSELRSVENLSDELLEKIRDAMLERARDVILQIRLQSITTLQCLQDPEDPDDLVVAAFIENLTNSNAKIRHASVKLVAPAPQVIPALLFRCRDVDESVKIATYKKFVEIPSQALTIVQRHTILRNGFKDPSETVQKVVKEKLLPEWLNCYDYNYLQLISAVLLDGNETEIKDTMRITETILTTLFSSQLMSGILEQLKLTDKLIPSENLTWESAIYWRCLIGHFRSSDEFENYLEQILPETVHFCDYILNYISSKDFTDMKLWEFNNFQMILLELIAIAIGCDVSDQCSRLRLKEMLLKILREDISTDIIHKIFVYLNKNIPLVDNRINFVCELISDIRNPMESNFVEEEYAIYEKKSTELKEQIHKLLDDQKNAVNEQNFQLAELLKADISELQTQLAELNEQQAKEEQVVKKNDPKTILKCVNIAIELLQSPQIHKLNNALRTLRNELLNDMVLVNIPEIQARIMMCYALCSYFDVECARDSIKLIGSALLSYKAKSADMDLCLLISAINSIVDLIMLYGGSIFPETSEKEPDFDSSDALEQMFSTPSFTDIIQILINMMDDPSPIIRETSGIGIMKIIGADRIFSPMLLSRLILKWFNPNTEQDVKFHQYLGVFLVNFNREPHAARQLEGAFVPTLRAMCRAPEDSPLSSIPGEKVAKFLVHLTEPKIIQNPDVHKRVAQDLCEEIESDITNIKCNSLYAKTLLLLDIATNDEDFLESLLIKCEELVDELDAIGHTSQIIRNIQKCIYRLKYYCNEYNKDEIKNEENNTSRSP